MDLTQAAENLRQRARGAAKREIRHCVIAVHYYAGRLRAARAGLADELDTDRLRAMIRALRAVSSEHTANLRQLAAH